MTLQEAAKQVIETSERLFLTETPDQLDAAIQELKLSLENENE